MLLLYVLLCAASGLGVEECVAHLLARSPGADAHMPNRALIHENVELALWTRQALPWGPSIPDSVFLRYVLPARVSQEPLTPWRPLFREHVLPLVEGVDDIQEAVLRISAWSDSVTEYRPTQFRDQSPLVTWSSGIGRCEELTVFFLCALRSVGIPCRQAYTPWWLTVDSNHAWPEVWTPEGWKCLEQVSTENRSPQENWFTERVRGVGLVLAIAPDSVPGALSVNSGVSFLGVTSAYTDTGLLRVEDDSTEVWVSTANYGSPRRLLRMGTSLRTAELGGGVYLLTWGWPVRSAVVEVVPGETTVFRPGRETGILPETLHLNTREAL